MQTLATKENIGFDAGNLGMESAIVTIKMQTFGSRRRCLASCCCHLLDEREYEREYIAKQQLSSQ
jgi:hypothetical protein